MPKAVLCLLAAMLTAPAVAQMQDLSQLPAYKPRTNVREFLDYILSREGQAGTVAPQNYYPLTKAKLLEERHKLD